MTVYKRGNIWWMDFVINGDRVHKTTKRTLKREALAVEQETREQFLNRKQLRTRESIAARKAFRMWYDEAGKHQADAKKHEMRLAKLFGESDKAHKGEAYFHISPALPFESIDSQLIDRLKLRRKAEGLAVNTIRLELAMIRAVHTWVRKTTMYRYSEDEINWSAGKPKTKIRVLRNADEEDALLKQLDPTLDRPGLAPYGTRAPAMQRMLQDQHDIVVFILDTGARYSEISTFDWDCVDFKSRTVNLYRWKVGNASTLAMTDRVYEMLTARFERRSLKSPYIFPSANGTSHRGYATAGIRRAMERAGLNEEHIVRKFGRLTVHSLRDTFATRCIKGGMNIVAVKDLLGHADIQMTMKYIHLVEAEATSQAASIMNLRSWDKNHVTKIPTPTKEYSTNSMVGSANY